MTGFSHPDVLRSFIHSSIRSSILAAPPVCAECPSILTARAQQWEAGGLQLMGCTEQRETSCRQIITRCIRVIDTLRASRRMGQRIQRATKQIATQRFGKEFEAEGQDVQRP